MGNYSGSYHNRFYVFKFREWHYSSIHHLLVFIRGAIFCRRFNNVMNDTVDSNIDTTYYFFSQQQWTSIHPHSYHIIIFKFVINRFDILDNNLLQNRLWCTHWEKKEHVMQNDVICHRLFDSECYCFGHGLWIAWICLSKNVFSSTSFPLFQFLQIVGPAKFRGCFIPTNLSYIRGCACQGKWLVV